MMFDPQTHIRDVCGMDGAGECEAYASFLETQQTRLKISSLTFVDGC